MPEEPKKPSSAADRPTDPGVPKDKDNSKPKHETIQGRRAGGMSALAQEAARLQQAAQPQAMKPTNELTNEEKMGIPGVAGHAFGSDFGAPQSYRVVPLSMASTNLPPETPRWRIELEGLGTGIEPVGLDILGDTVIGRGRVGNQPVDLDMDEYGGLEQGVSRRHALLRPTANHLYIIDLGSTNGTMHNGLPLGPGITRSLKHNDSVTLGRLSFSIKMIDGPGMHKPAPPPAVEGDSEPTRPLNADAAVEMAAHAAETRVSEGKIPQEMIDARRKELEAQGKLDSSKPGTNPLDKKPEVKPAGTPPEAKPAEKPAEPAKDARPAEEPQVIETVEMPKERLFSTSGGTPKATPKPEDISVDAVLKAGTEKPKALAADGPPTDPGKATEPGQSKDPAAKPESK